MIMISEGSSKEELAKVLVNLHALGNHGGGGHPSSSAGISPTLAAATVPGLHHHVHHHNPYYHNNHNQHVLNMMNAMGMGHLNITPAAAVYHHHLQQHQQQQQQQHHHHHQIPIHPSASSSPAETSNEDRQEQEQEGDSPSALVAELNASSASALPSFPVKLYEMMQDASTLGFEDVVSWQPPLPGRVGGKGTSSSSSNSFKVHNTDRFVKEIMARYFKQTRYKSFQRQLNIYGFQRIHEGPHRGGYQHPYFIRGAPELLKLIPRKRGEILVANRPLHAAAAAAAAAVVAASSSSSSHHPPPPTVLPTDGYHLLKTLYPGTAAPSSLLTHEQQLQLANILTSSDASPALHSLLLSTQPQVSPAVAAAAAAYASVAGSAAPPPVGSAGPTNANQHVFPWKLFKMLQDAPQQGFSHIVSWVNDGDSFKVHNTKDFVQLVMPQYFDQTKYESFRRQLNLYGFTRIVRGQHRGVYSHPLFRRDHKDWCRYISRQQQQPQQQQQGQPPSSDAGHAEVEPI
jgi:hypothetical protein